MNPAYYGLVEMAFSFGVILAIAFWQLYAVRKAIRKAKEEDAAKQAAERAAGVPPDAKAESKSAP